jgi:hypothetical protein|tara:strand:+ start:5474 stop:5764 length:291 start_codon:yes stop_codon:yes gene_type:complete
MSKQDDKIFGEGIFFKQKDNAPSFVMGAVSIKVDEFIVFLKENEKKGWVNLDLKESKGGKHYFQLDTWEPNPKMGKEKPVAKAKASAPVDTDEIPF